MTDKKYWISSHPEKCDICQAPIDTEFIDGATVFGPWACMCRSCHDSKGKGLGTGKGQLYQKDTDGEFAKIKG